MTNDVFYLFDCMHHLAQLLAMAPYTRKWSRETSRYEYSPHMNKTQYFTVAGKTPMEFLSLPASLFQYW